MYARRLGCFASGAKLHVSSWMHMHPPKIQNLVIIVKFSPYMHHPYLILMHPQGSCTPNIFALASPLFCMPASSIIPLHNHPGMTVLGKVLYGAAHVRSYRWIESAGSSINLSKARPAKVVRDGEMSAPCGAMVLRPEEGGDVHALRAITPCAVLHILTPPYSSQDGRHCSYFRRRPRSHPSGVLLNRTGGSEFVWLEEYQPRHNFIIRRDLYTGPALKL